MYTTIEQFKARLGVNFDAFYAADADALADLVAAAAEIDGVIANRYVIPVTAPDALALLDAWNLTLAEELAWGNPSGGNEIPAKITRRIDRVRALLDAVAAGDFVLPGAAQCTAGGGSVSIVEGSRPLFRREDLQGF